MPANDLVLLDSIVEKSKAYLGKNLELSELFELFCFDQILKNYDLSYEELEYGHVDGGDDGGIDGLFILLDDNLVTEDTDTKSIRRNPEIEVIVITCKYGAQFKQIPLNNLNSSLLELFDLRKMPDDILYPFGDSIIEIRELFRNLYIDLAEKNPSLKFRIYYTSRGDTTNLNPNITSRAQDLELKLSGLFSKVEAQVIFLGVSELLQIARKQKTYALRISFIENVISRARTNYIILTTLSDYYHFITDEDGQLRRYLFESNVRDYLGANNSVISDIKDSLESSLSKEEADFWWFSNGITLLASSAVIVGKELSLENVQIVNGLQTTNAIYEHFSQTKSRNDERALLLKIVLTDNEDVRVKIIKATNYQNAVDLASLRATDKIQRDIEEFLAKHDWFYDRRKNYYKNQGKTADRIVSTSYLGAAVRALALKSPSKAAEQQTKWMKLDDDYKKVFNLSLDLQVFLICLEICRVIDPILRDRTRPVGVIPNIDNKKSKYLVGLIYVAKYLKNSTYSPNDVAAVKHYPDVFEIKAIVEHIKASIAKYKASPKSAQKRKITIGELADISLKELAQNQFEYLAYVTPPPNENTPNIVADAAERVKPRQHMRLASDLERERRFDGALEHLQACLEMDLPEERLSLVHAHIGRILSRMGKYGESLEHYETAIKMGVQTSELYAGYARSLYKMGAAQNLIQKYFEEAIELDNTNAYAQSWYATFLKSISEMQKAKEYAQRALELSPNNPMFLHNLALILIEANPDREDLLQAKELLEKAIPLSAAHFKFPEETLHKVKEMLM